MISIAIVTRNQKRKAYMFFNILDSATIAGILYACSGMWPAMRDIEPMQKIAKMLPKHEPLLLNWFESRGISSGVVEGFNNNAQWTKRKAFGFKDSETMTTALYPSTWKPF
jgi:hypothetical protein